MIDHIYDRMFGTCNLRANWAWFFVLAINWNFADSTAGACFCRLAFGLGGCSSFSIWQRDLVSFRADFAGTYFFLILRLVLLVNVEITNNLFKSIFFDWN